MNTKNIVPPPVVFASVTRREGKTFDEAVDDAIENEKKRRRGCANVSVPVVTVLPENKSRRMLAAIKALEKCLTNGDYRRCA